MQYKQCCNVFQTMLEMDVKNLENKKYKQQYKRIV